MGKIKTIYLNRNKIPNEAQVSIIHYQAAYLSLYENFRNYRKYIVERIEGICQRLEGVERTVSKLQDNVEVQQLTLASLIESASKYQLSQETFVENEYDKNSNVCFENESEIVSCRQDPLDPMAMKAVGLVTKTMWESYASVPNNSNVQEEISIIKPKEKPKVACIEPMIIRDRPKKKPAKKIDSENLHQNYSCFDRNNTGNSLFLDEGARVTNTGNGALSFLNTKLKFEERISFEITFNPNRKPAIGLCQVPTAVTNHFRWNHKNDGSHFMFPIESTLPHLLNNDTEKMVFDRKNMKQTASVSLNFDRKKQRLFFWHRGEWHSVSITIDQFNQTDIMPCVYLSSPGDTVKILSSSIIKNDDNEFDYNLKGPIIKFDSPAQITNQGNGDIALLADSVPTCPSKRFLIRVSSSDRIAFGLFSQRIVSESGFKWSGKSNHGCYLFYGNGERLKPGSEFSFTPQVFKVCFAQGETVELTYDWSTGKLLCTNLSKPSFGEMTVADVKDLNEYFLGVCLPCKDDEVSLAN